MSQAAEHGAFPADVAGEELATGSYAATHPNRQAVQYCPYCSEETLFPLEGGGWECRSCSRAFSVTFLGLVSPGRKTAQEVR